MHHKTLSSLYNILRETENKQNFQEFNSKANVRVNEILKGWHGHGYNNQLQGNGGNGNQNNHHQGQK